MTNCLSPIPSCFLAYPVFCSFVLSLDSRVERQTKSTVGAYIRRKPERLFGSLASRFEETDEALLGVANFGTYSRSEVEILGGVFLAFARYIKANSKTLVNQPAVWYGSRSVRKVLLSLLLSSSIETTLYTRRKRYRIQRGFHSQKTEAEEDQKSGSVALLYGQMCQDKNQRMLRIVQNDSRNTYYDLDNSLLSVLISSRTRSGREGDRFTYDMWRKAIMSNSGVRMLKGLQFGMLDEDNDGEVSLSDISRAVFRRAGDRDLSRIRKFLEVIFFGDSHI